MVPQSEVLSYSATSIVKKLGYNEIYHAGYNEIWCLKFQLSVSPTTVVIIALVVATTNMTHVTSKGIVVYKLQTLDWLANLFKYRQFSMSNQILQ